MRFKALFVPTIWKYEVLLRRYEYYYNKSNTFINCILKTCAHIKLKRYEIKVGGVQIPPNVCGPGLCVCHKGTIIINDNVRIGSNARIHAGVNIGNLSKLGDDWVPDNTPIIGNNVYIGPGAKLFGKITIGDNVAIGANAVVNRDVPSHVSVAGVPAKIINKNGSMGLLIRGVRSK